MALPGVNTMRGYAGDPQAVPMAPMVERERTELERWATGLGGSTRRISDMLDAFESRLDRVQMAPSAIGNAANPDKEPPEPPPGTIAAIDRIDGKLENLCGRLDSLLCRLYRIV